MPRRAHEGHGPRAQGRAGAVDGGPERRRRGDRGRDARRGVRSRVRGEGGAPRRRRADRRRAHGRRARRWLVLRHRGGPHHGWLGRGLAGGGRPALAGEARGAGGGTGMSWQAGAYALLALVLLGGVGWYERPRPTARLDAPGAALVALALAAGPALVRMISRYRGRFEFTWRGAGATTLAMLLALVLALGGSRAEARGASSAAAWLHKAQNGDGGFPSEPGGASSAAMTGWASLGLEAAGRNPADVRSGGSSAIGYLRAHVGDVRSTGDLERTILALEGAGVNARRFGGRDLPAELRSRRSPSGTFGGEV